ncbi:MAG: hypothetical protein ACPL4K_06240 [Candidatus Margulisiibacteriota bacterium]
MWQPLGIVVLSSFGGSILLHFSKNFFLIEKTPFRFDWDGLIERGIITFCLISHSYLYLIPIVIFTKTIFRLGQIIIYNYSLQINEPGTVFQKVRLKAELFFDLILSPSFALFLGIIFS